MTRTTIIVGPILLLVTIIYGFYWDAARKEIYYLCGNFTKGVSINNVIRQLDTANLSSYKLLSDKQTISFSSKVNIGYYQCLIYLDKAQRVNSASFVEGF
ncbi:hypothetical protein tloyanaT_28570 [Thalassotalea loyana]|uniref:DUF3192 domain-containing protein n=1 Tax=Thalassotalea loyana TaxID=280483 RepID=A0ABQ6HG64_9GAMM|nr:hypothetical protein tloyanaT_28570 [Thalassotalea loyana]